MDIQIWFKRLNALILGKREKEAMEKALASSKGNDFDQKKTIKQHFMRKKREVVAFYQDDLLAIDTTYQLSLSYYEPYVVRDGFVGGQDKISAKELAKKYEFFIDRLVKEEECAPEYELGTVDCLLEAESEHGIRERNHFLTVLNYIEGKERSPEESLRELTWLFVLIRERKDRLEAIEKEEFKALYDFEHQQSTRGSWRLNHLEDPLETEEKELFASLRGDYYLSGITQITLNELNQNDQDSFISLFKKENPNTTDEVMKVLMEVVKEYDVELVNEYVKERL